MPRPTARVRALVAGTVTAVLAAAGVAGAVAAQAVDSCRVEFATNSWPGGFVSEARLTTGPARSSWTLTFELAPGQQVTNAWSSTLSQSGTTVTARNASWNGTLAAGATAQLGFQGTTSGSSTVAPTDVRVDGVLCDGQAPSTSPTPSDL